jgi:hypothetical protein
MIAYYKGRNMSWVQKLHNKILCQLLLNRRYYYLQLIRQRSYSSLYRTLRFWKSIEQKFGGLCKQNITIHLPHTRNMLKCFMSTIHEARCEDNVPVSTSSRYGMQRFASTEHITKPYTPVAHMVPAEHWNHIPLKICWMYRDETSEDRGTIILRCEETPFSGFSKKMAIFLQCISKF